MSKASRNSGSNGSHYPVPPQGGYQTRPEYDPQSHGGHQGSSADRGHNGVVHKVPPIDTSGQYKPTYNHVQAGQNGGRKINAKEASGGTSAIVPGMGGS